MVTILSDKLAELEELARDILTRNVVGRTPLRSFVGKAQSVASIVFVMRPFLADIWGALSAPEAARPASGPANCVWLRQIEHAVTWLLAFFAGSRLGICRRLSVDAYLGRGVRVTVGLDASPWGLGGWLRQGDVLLQYFASPLGPDDFEVLGHSPGCASGQQTWECLAVLVALRLWASVLSEDRVRLHVKSDNMTALYMTASLRSTRGTSTAVVSRELALTMAEHSFAPDAVSHTPGISNHAADCLSRKAQPGFSFTLPAELQ